MNTTNPSLSAARPRTHEEISRHAQELWEKYGRPEGRDEEIWLEAERELQRPASAEPAPTLTPAPTSAAATTVPASTVSPVSPASAPPTRAPQRPSRAAATARMPGNSRNSRSGAK